MFRKYCISVFLAAVLTFSSVPLAFAEENNFDGILVPEASEEQIGNPESYVSDEILVVFSDNENLESKHEMLIEELHEGSLKNVSTKQENTLLPFSTLSNENNQSADEPTSIMTLDAGDVEEPIALVELSEELSVAQAIAIAEATPGVEFAQPNYLYTTLEEDTPVVEVQKNAILGLEDEVLPSYSIDDPKSTDSSDPQYQWWLDNTHVRTAWDTSRSEGAVTVAVIDTGARLTHSDLVGNLATDSEGTILAWDTRVLNADGTYGNYLESSPRANNGDDDGHGTHVAGLVSAVADNGVLGAGSSYNARILPVAFSIKEDGKTKATTADMVNAYNYILSLPDYLNIRVINVSMGGYSTAPDKALHSIIKKATARGILTVAAAGNGNTANTIYPSDFDEVLSVVSVDSNNTRASSSDYNEHKDVAAPGVSIYSTGYSSDTAFVQKNGTSMASPIVAGIASLLFTANPNLSSEQVRELLCSTALDLGAAGRDNYYGWGLVVADDAVLAASAETPIAYSIFLDAQGGTVSSAHLENIAFYSLVNTLPEPVRKGYTFLGWFSEPDGKGERAVEPIRILGDLTYYAHWELASKRLFGDTRYDTMQAVSGEGWITSDCVIVATGEDFPDALAVSAFAGIYDAPVILTERTVLSAQARDVIERLGASKVFIAGGPVSVSSEVEQAIWSISSVIEVTRLAGENRFKTALNIYETGVGSWAGDTAIVASGLGFADALSVSSFANSKKAPIFLAGEHGLDSDSLTVISNAHFSTIIIVGGSAVVPANVEQQLSDSSPGSLVTRLGGANRYATSVMIVDYAMSNSGGMLSYNQIVCATGRGFADALAGGPFAGHMDTVLLLVDDTVEGRYSFEQVIHNNHTSINKAYALGGVVSIPESLYDDLIRVVTS